MDINQIVGNLQAVGIVIDIGKLKFDKWTDAKNINKQTIGYIVNTKNNVCTWLNRSTLEKGSFPLDRGKVTSRFDYQKAIRDNDRQQRDKYFTNALAAAKKYNSIQESKHNTCPYLEQKQVYKYGCKIDKNGDLVIPFRSLDIKPDGRVTSYIRTLQTIKPDGTKLFEKDCEKKSSMHLVGFNKIYQNPQKYTGKILVAEGYATAASLFMATGLPTVVAIDAGNLDPVMSKVTKVYSGASFVICADNDLKTEIKTGKNVGIEAAMACQSKYKCQIVYPQFDNAPSLTDFNDLHVVSGLETVAKSIESHIFKIEASASSIDEISKNIKYLTDVDDILNSQAQVIVNPVNCIGIMGKGLALKFKEAYPENFAAYQNACKNKEINIGKIHLFKIKGSSLPEYIVNFPTKDHWRNKSELSFIEKGLDDLIKTINQNQIKSIALPALGCGLGGLDWKVVLPLIENKLSPIPELKIIIHEPINNRLRIQQTEQKVNILLNTNEDVLKHYEKISPELVNQVRRDGGIDVPGPSGGQWNLKDEDPEYLAQLFAKATGEKISQAETSIEQVQQMNHSR